MLYHILAFLLFIGMIVISYLSLKIEDKKLNILIKILALFLLLYKTIELSYGIFIKENPAKYPVEFSTIFYFLFSVVLLTDNKKLLGVSSIGALLSGLGYLITLIFNINNMIELQSSINNMPGFLLGALSHSILFYLSFIMLSKYKFDYKKEILGVNLIAIGIAIHAHLMGLIIDFDDYYLFIYLVNSAKFTGSLESFFTTNFITMSLYFIMAWIIYNIVIFGIYKMNHFLYNTFKKNTTT